MDFLAALLVECCPDSAIAKLIKCGRTKSVAITEHISKQASEQIFPILRNTKFSLIVDETTDVSMIESLDLVASNFIKHELFHNDVDVNFKDKCNHRSVADIFIGTKAELFMKGNLCSDEIIEVKMKALLFYIEFLDQLKARFDFNREDIKMLQIITSSKVLSTQDLQILPLVLQFAHLVDEF
ncbi:PREDICTED: uncharacterized protein LOC108360848 [Rhagoletis zephyria]|uniref:uncharacterized protein LOC108360848 n=1 Tax=Rhagoletis zephyria TaxID=28612 RepID=UPI0008115E6D|nr:PREDICTED: uncharacterized protein LOC108360848 [Rhagoletis zephyria]